MFQCVKVNGSKEKVESYKQTGTKLRSRGAAQIAAYDNIRHQTSDQQQHRLEPVHRKQGRIKKTSA